MQKVEEIVLKCYKQVVEARGFEVEISLDNKVSDEYGIDSLNFVELILNIEEELDVELDSILAKVRKSKTVRDIVFIINDYINKIIK